MPVETHRFQTIDSTNEEAKRQLKAGKNELVVLAEEQRNGKGTQNRIWQSTPGGIYFTYGKRSPRFDQNNISHLTSTVAEKTVGIIHTLTKIPVELEWPNDIILGIKKVGGILIECNSTASQSTPNYVIIGIGINANQTQFTGAIANTATSLHNFRNSPVDKDALINALIKEIPTCL